MCNPVDKVLNQRFPRKVSQVVVTQRWLSNTDLPEEKGKSSSTAYADNKKRIRKANTKG